MLLLLSVEALDLMVLKGERLSSDFWQIVNEANHGLRAFRIKLIVIACFNLRPLVNALLLRLLVRVRGDILLNIVAQVSDEAHSVLEFDVQGLVVNSRPLSVNDLLIALAFLAAFAEDGLSLVALDQVDSVRVVLRKLELMALVNELDLVRHRVSTQLLGIEQIDVALVRADLEIPDTVQLLTDAVDWLISCHKSLFVTEWVDVGY